MSSNHPLAFKEAPVSLDLPPRTCSMPTCGNALDERDDWYRRDGRCATCVEEAENLLTTILDANPRDGIDTGACGVLVVNQITYPRDTPIAKVLAHSARAESVILTSDGRGVHRSGWHVGDESEWVYVERWTAEGRVFHGFIDSVTRKLVQVG